MPACYSNNKPNVKLFNKLRYHLLKYVGIERRPLPDLWLSNTYIQLIPKHHNGKPADTKTHIGSIYGNCYQRKIKSTKKKTLNN